MGAQDEFSDINLALALRFLEASQLLDYSALTAVEDEMTTTSRRGTLRMLLLIIRMLAEQIAADQDTDYMYVVRGVALQIQLNSLGSNDD